MTIVATDPWLMGATQLADAIRSRQVSSSEVVQASIDPRWP
jgi:hypothetical protein